MADRKSEQTTPATNVLEISFVGRLVLSDVVMHQTMKDQPNVFPNLIILAKLEDAQTQGSVFQGNGTPEGKIVQLSYRIEWEG